VKRKEMEEKNEQGWSGVEGKKKNQPSEGKWDKKIDHLGEREAYQRSFA